MLNMSDINDIRDLYSRGYKIGEICKKTGYDPKTIRKYLEKDDFSEDAPVLTDKTSILDPYKKLIADWLREDQQHWDKQRHTAKRVYDRLREEHGFTGSYETVQRYMKEQHRNLKERATQELVWDPGYAQVDFGEGDFYENTLCVRRKYLVVSFPYSNDSFSQVFCGETAECVCQGLKDIFEYIGGVPPVLVFDNATGVGRRVRDKVIETDLFRRFRAHYRFRVRFCNPESGWEKGNVENKVGTVRRNLFVPVPHYHDLLEYNRGLLQMHEKKASEPHYKKGLLISELFLEDQKSFMELPAKPFNVCRYDYFKADGYGKICVDGKHYYSTRPEYHGQKVLAGVRAHFIEVLDAKGHLVVRHKRQYGSDRTDTSDYSTTLRVLSRNSGAWMNSGVRKDLPDPLVEYLDSLEKQELKDKLRLLSRLNDEYGYSASVKAMGLALKNGNVNRSDATIIARRITGYGIDTPPESGPPLSVYDKAFIPNLRGGEVS
jgi:transposase